MQCSLLRCGNFRGATCQAGPNNVAPSLLVGDRWRGTGGQVSPLPPHPFSVSHISANTRYELSASSRTARLPQFTSENEPSMPSPPAQSRHPPPDAPPTSPTSPKASQSSPCLPSPQATNSTGGGSMGDLTSPTGTASDARHHA